VCLAAIAAACSERGSEPPPEAHAEEVTDRDTAGEDLPGRWRRAEADPGPGSPAQKARLEELRAIGYAGGTRAASDRSGVTVHDPARAFPGLNFYNSGHEPGAVLMDMQGRVLHRWRRAFDEIWPEAAVAPSNRNVDFWRRARLHADGSVVAIFEGLGIFRVDRDSRVIWAALNGAHHDVWPLDNGDLWVLTRIAHVVPRVDPTEPILEDFLTLLAPDGSEKRRISLLEAFERGGHARIWESSRVRQGDIFHTNTVHVIDEARARRPLELTPGRILSASPRLNLVFLVDPVEQRVVRVWSAGFFGLHDPRLLANGHLLVFDNQGHAGASRVVELDPASSRVVWEYRGDAANPFFSKTCGTAVRLPGGTTLVTESDAGRAFEVTPAGAIVWEFRSPHRAGMHDELVATLFELARLPAGFPTPWARGPQR
jgi:hypothetical protein